MEDRALIVGAAAGNIGSAIDAEIGAFMPTEAISLQGQRDIPSPEDIGHNYRYLVVSCGFTEIKPLDELDQGTVLKIVNANLTTPLLLIRNFLIATRFPQPGEDCCVVVIGSYAHDHVLSNSVAYCAAKAGINHAIKCLAWDYGDKGYRFHCINPHSVEDTPMTREVITQIQMTKQMTEAEALDYWKRTLILPNRLTRAEVARTVSWLIFDAPTMHLNGSSIELYGGER